MMMSTHTAAPTVTANPLEALYQLLNDEITAVDAYLDKAAYSEVSVLPLVSRHITNSGGKRIRPLLTLAAAKLCGYDNGTRHVELAACIELFHTITLLHDDVVDESTLRRGRPTANAVWGNQLSILTGDFLLGKLFHALVMDGELEILRLFAITTQKVVEGEVLQLTSKHNLQLSQTDYFKIIEGKTAVLFGAALELGAMLADATQDHRQALNDYALNLGIAFQLIDDVLDYTADQPVLGKPVGNDYHEGQVTLPVILVRDALAETSEDRMFLAAAFDVQNEKTDDNLSRLTQLLKSHGVMDRIKQQAAEYSKKAANSLSIFPDSQLKQLLIDLTGFVINRCN